MASASSCEIPLKLWLERKDLQDAFPSASTFFKRLLSLNDADRSAILSTFGLNKKQTNRFIETLHSNITVYLSSIRVCMHVLKRCNKNRDSYCGLLHLNANSVYLPCHWVKKCGFCHSPTNCIFAIHKNDNNNNPYLDPRLLENQRKGYRGRGHDNNQYKPQNIQAIARQRSMGDKCHNDGVRFTMRHQEPAQNPRKAHRLQSKKDPHKKKRDASNTSIQSNITPTNKGIETAKEMINPFDDEKKRKQFRMSLFESAKILFKQRKWNETREALFLVMENNGDNDHEINQIAYEKLGDVCVKLYESNVDNCKETMPASSQHALIKADMYYKTAINCYLDNTNKLNTSRKPTIYIKYANLLQYELKQYKAAEALYSDYIRSDPHNYNSDVYFHYANLLESMGKYKESKKNYLKCLEFKESQTKASLHYRLGMLLYYKLLEKEKGINHVLKCTELAPNIAKYHLEHALMLKHTNDPKYYDNITHSFGKALRLSNYQDSSVIVQFAQFIMNLDDASSSYHSNNETLQSKSYEFSELIEPKQKEYSTLGQFQLLEETHNDNNNESKLKAEKEKKEEKIKYDLLAIKYASLHQHYAEMQQKLELTNIVNSDNESTDDEDGELLLELQQFVHHGIARLNSVHNQIIEVFSQTTKCGIMKCPQLQKNKTDSNPHNHYNTNNNASNNNNQQKSNKNDNNPPNNNENQSNDDHYGGNDGNDEDGDEKKTNELMLEPCNHLTECTQCCIKVTRKCEEIKMFKALLLSLQEQHEGHVSFVGNLSEAIAKATQKRKKKSKAKNRKKIADFMHYKPRYEPSFTALQNIEISRRLTEDIIPNTVKEPIAPKYVYSYLNKSIAMQHNDKQLIWDPSNERMPLNTDLHEAKTNEPLYGLISKINQQHYIKWKLDDKLYTETELSSFNVRIPSSSRDSLHKMEDITFNEASVDKMIKSCQWNMITVFNVENNKDRITLAITQKQLNPMIKKSLLEIGSNAHFIHILMFDHHTHWMEYLVIVDVYRNDLQIEDTQIAVSLRYSEMNGFKISGIHLNKDKLLEQHLALRPHECHCLDAFDCRIHNIRVGNPDSLENKMNALNSKYHAFKQLIYTFVHSEEQNKYETFEEQAQMVMKYDNGTLNSALGSIHPPHSPSSSSSYGLQSPPSSSPPSISSHPSGNNSIRFYG